jgi:hypothetical protein
MSSAAPTVEPEWTDDQSAWAEVLRIVGHDPVAVAFLQTMATVWSKAGTDSYFGVVRELQTLRDLVRELGPTITRLRRRIPGIEAAARGMERDLGRGSSCHGGLKNLPAGIEAAVEVFTSLEAHVDKVFGAYAGTAPGRLRERPTDLVAALKAAARRIPAIAPLLTPRGLALYEIASRRDARCTSETVFVETRCERWKKNLRRSRRGT